ncbi:MAG: NIPSNAP family protein [Anaerolineae bacterium]
MFFEFRQYRIKDNRVSEWVELMEKEIIPFQESQGMVVAGSFIAPEQPDLYVWIRRFESESERERLYKAVYESNTWNDVIKPKIDQLLLREKIMVTRLEPTAISTLR